MNRVPLQDICSEVIDCINKTAPTVDYLTPYKMLRTPNVRSGKVILEGMKCVDEETFNKWNRRVTPQKGDIILTREAPLGEVGMLPDVKNVFLGQRLMLYRVNCELANPYYVLYEFLCSDLQSQIHSQGSGSTVTHLRVPDAENLTILLPEREIQDKVAYILTRYDNLIENNNRRIAILEEMAQKLYREWFVHFRFPGHENVKMVESEMGLIPEGWTVQSPKEVADHYIGGGWGKECSSDALRPAFVIRGTDIPNARHNDVVNCPLRYHTQSNLKDRCLSNGDVVIEVSGGSKGQPVGRPLLITSELLDSFSGQQVICASFCKLYRCNTSLINPYYLYLWLLEMYKNGEIEKYQSQSTGIINFKFEYFLDSPIILAPHSDIQDEFNKQVEMTFKQINVLGKKNANLRKTRDLLLPRLISGDIDVSNLDIPVKEG